MNSLWQRIWHGTKRTWNRTDWARFVSADWTQQIMNAPVTDRFHAKQGRSTGRWILHAGEHRLSVYLKRHYQLPWWRGLLALLWPRPGWSPAWQEWRHLQWAEEQGLPVPRAVAAGEYIGPGPKLQSFLAVEELAGMLPLNEAIPLAAERLDPATFQNWKGTLIKEMVRLTRRLHDRRHFHKDLYLCHFYILESDTAEMPDWSGRVHLIDLHRLGYHPLTWPVWQVKDLGQLLYSSDVPGVGPRDRMRFWRGYSRGMSVWKRWLRQLILAKYRRYRQHNAKRKRITAMAEVR